MPERECSFESEVLAAVVEGRWPLAVEPSLREHAEACPLCSEVLTVADALAPDRQALKTAPSLPAAGTVWWRAQIRARRDAADAAARPLLVAQAAAFVVALAILGMAGKALLPSFTILAGEYGGWFFAAAAAVLVVPAAILLALRRSE